MRKPNDRSEAEATVFTTVLEARQAASHLGMDVIVHLLNMALVEIGSEAARKIDIVDVDDDPWDDGLIFVSPSPASAMRRS